MDVRLDAVVISSSSPCRSSPTRVATNQSGGLVDAAPTRRRLFGGRPTEEEVIAFGGIANPARSSPRLRAKPDADLPQVERAIGLAQRRASLFESGTSSYSKLSFATLPNDVIAAHASRLGISLGTSPTQINNSVTSLKCLEESRHLTFLENNLPPDDDENEHSLVFKKASNLCEDLENDFEEGVEEHLDLLSGGVKVSRSRKKVVINKLNVRRSARLQSLKTNSK